MDKRIELTKLYKGSEVILVDLQRTKELLEAKGWSENKPAAPKKAKKKAKK